MIFCLTLFCRSSYLYFIDPTGMIYCLTLFCQSSYLYYIDHTWLYVFYVLFNPVLPVLIFLIFWPYMKDSLFKI